MLPLTSKMNMKQRAHVFSLLVALTGTLLAPFAFAKKDLFAKDPGSQSSVPAQQLITPPQEEPEPKLTPSDAASVAQRHTDGQVMNVRKLKEDEKTLYGVKVLQKNGRMSTVNVDANSGTVVE